VKIALGWILIAASLTGTAQATDFATQALEATYKLFNKDSTATGFFVRIPPTPGNSGKGLVLVTAGHVLTKMSGDTAIIVLRQPAGDGSYRRRDFPVAIRAQQKPLWTAHPDQDVAVMRVELPAEAAVAGIPLDCLASEEVLKEVHLHVASPLCVLGFPTRFEANSAGFPVARHASIASFPLTPVKLYKTFLADFSTFNGDSGGPVFTSDSRLKEAAEAAPPLVIGMVLAQFRHDEKINTLYEERILHEPLGLANVLQAQYVRETIAMLGK
jgi:hypothetical protein